ncbi:MAG: hypothetical protein KDI33_14940 [Halioglobus sp.]|nr:hypothetical protein [Halioglobus sp.]
MHYYISSLLLALAFAVLTGCGQMGPLYMPPEETPPPPALSAPAAAPTVDSGTEQPRKQP